MLKICLKNKNQKNYKTRRCEALESGINFVDQEGREREDSCYTGRVREIYSVELNGEITEIEYREGQFFIEGYDLENERVALLLRGGQGGGIGVLLLALEECGEIKQPKQEFFSVFSESMRGMGSEPDREQLWVDYIKGNLSVLALTYLSYSSHLEVRRMTCYTEGLSEKTWERLLQDKDNEVLLTALRNASGPQEVLEKLAHSPSVVERYWLAQNKHLSIRAQVALARDPDKRVWTVFQQDLKSRALPGTVTEILKRRWMEEKLYELESENQKRLDQASKLRFDIEILKQQEIFLEREV